MTLNPEVLERVKRQISDAEATAAVNRGRLKALYEQTASDLRALLSAVEGDGWLPIESAPRCYNGAEDGTNGTQPVLVTRFPFTGHHAPMAVARLAKKGWLTGRAPNRLWFEPTHWRPLPAPPRPAGGEG